MIVRNVNGIIKIITGVPKSQEDKFIEKNPTGEFMKIDYSLPFAQYNNYKLENDKIVVDEEREAEAAAIQYRLDRSYPSIEEQLDMMYWDKINGTDNWVQTITEVKNSVPKPK